MKHVTRILLVTSLIMLISISLYAQVNFFTSIHATRAGKNFWYGADTSVTKAPAPGFESLTNVPITHPNVACNACHPADNLDANGDAYPIPYPGAGCVDCHATKFGFTVTEEDCYGCHSRQATEKNQLGYSDVHRDASNPLKCWDCHKEDELHGDDGVAYKSMFEPGAMRTDCGDCHTTAGGTLPDHSSYDPHGGKLHCDACHAQTVVSCYNCHFESQVESHLKRAKQPIHGFVILANRAKDGKVGTLSFQSLTYQGHSWAAFGPFHSHSITGDGRECADCHQNFGGQVEAIQQYNATGEIKFAEWNSSDSTLSWLKGVVPFPEDYETTFKMDFITYNGNPSDPVVPSKNWSAIGEDTWDGHQLFFASALTADQMNKLGMKTASAGNFYLGVGSPASPVGTSCASCHNSNSFASPVYGEWRQTAHASAQDGLSFLTYSCLSCHNTGWDSQQDNHGADEYVVADTTAPFGWRVIDQANWDRTKNVQCESCHGPLGAETGGLSADHNTPAGAPNLTAENCGQCHEGSHHPTFSDWQRSKHAVAKVTSIPGGAFNFIPSNRNCAGCHTAEGFIQFVDQVGLEPDVDPPGMDGNDLTCASCHDPHGSSNTGQLRIAAKDICQKCHNPEYSPDSPEPDGSDLHHTTAFMFEGKGGYHYPGYTYPSSAHKFVVSENCVDCHVFMVPFVGEPEEIPAYTGHSFEPRLESCDQSGCHQDQFDIADSSFDYRGVQTEIDSLSDILHGKLAEASSADSQTVEFFRAKFNYDFVDADGSHGIHNTRYARALLVSAMENYTPTGIAQEKTDLPLTYNLSQNYPNPFNPTTQIKFSIPEVSNVKITIFDAIGREIAVLVNKELNAGNYTYSWNATNLASGIYFYRMEANGFSQIRKMMFIK